MPPVLLPVTGSDQGPLGRPATLADAVAVPTSGYGWLRLGGRQMPVSVSTVSAAWPRLTRSWPSLSLNGQGIARAGWEYDLYRYWPALLPGDEVSLTLNGARFVYRVSQVEAVPANWERFAAADARADDLVLIVAAGATRQVVRAVPVIRQ